MRFIQPEQFLSQAILLGLVRIDAAAKFCSASSNRVGSRHYDNWTDEPLSIRLSLVASECTSPVRRRLVMQINGLTQLHGAQSISAPHFNRTSAPAAPTATPLDTTDELHLSPAAQMASRMSEIPDIRWERVNSIKAAIADGTYMSEDKVNVAVERLLDEFA
jgi:negative regulator of flagellin synthesis FlgM